TYNSDAQVGESSACATALLSGVKANYETVGLDSSGRFNNCLSSVSSRVPSLFNWAQEQGKATGLVTNTRLTHATPAAAYAHSASRYWEDDSKMPAASRRTCKDIARQLVEDLPGRNINVLLGGGRRHLVSGVTRDPETGREGRRLDGRNLVEDWLRDKKSKGLQAEYVWSKDQLERVNVRTMDHLLDSDKSAKSDPTIAEMTRVALQILLRNTHGFVLLVEALDETLGLEAAVMEAMSQVDLIETLIVFTADHSNVLTMGGLTTPRGHPVLGLDTKVSDVDGKPYTTLLYGNGPGYTEPRTVPQGKSRDIIQSSAVPRTWSTHGGEDVPVFASGPLANILFSGTFDQSYIPHAIAYIACLGEYAKRCSMFSNSNSEPTITNSSLSCPAAPAVSAVMSDDSSTLNRTLYFSKRMFKKNLSSINQFMLVPSFKAKLLCYIKIHFTMKNVMWISYTKNTNQFNSCSNMPIVVVSYIISISWHQIICSHMIHYIDNNGNLTTTSEIYNNWYLTGEYDIYINLWRKNKTKFPHRIFLFYKLLLEVPLPTLELQLQESHFASSNKLKWHMQNFHMSLIIKNVHKYIFPSNSGNNYWYFKNQFRFHIMKIFRKFS
ncbi:hypothetical protein C0J52_04213, partial [Blattella germanica]